jgi:hypothetical protein
MLLSAALLLLLLLLRILRWFRHLLLNAGSHPLQPFQLTHLDPQLELMCIANSCCYEVMCLIKRQPCAKRATVAAGDAPCASPST